MSDPIAARRELLAIDLDEEQPELAACLGPSLESLEHSVRAMRETEVAIERGLREAAIDTLKTAAICLGGERMTSSACVVAAAQQVRGLWELSELAERYTEEVARYKAELASHLECLSNANRTPK